MNDGFAPFVAGQISNRDTTKQDHPCDGRWRYGSALACGAIGTTFAELLGFAILWDRGRALPAMRQPARKTHLPALWGTKVPTGSPAGAHAVGLVVFMVHWVATTSPGLSDLIPTAAVC